MLYMPGLPNLMKKADETFPASPARPVFTADFSGEFRLIVFFVALALGIAMLAGAKPLYYFLLVVLLGMVLVNTDKFINLLRR
jgi:hypothetical protein